MAAEGRRWDESDGRRGGDRRLEVCIEAREVVEENEDAADARAEAKVDVDVESEVWVELKFEVEAVGLSKADGRRGSSLWAKASECAKGERDC